ncbi:MAG TPA: hypothetical protein VGQ93_09345 [Lysobacter sp.]|jgi:hypothetical protein|nr:hypothetical protein [Lysobacter sp.]
MVRTKADLPVSVADRVAVVVVHGIADQRPGQTVREIVRLLCHGGDGAPRFVQGEMHDVLVPVAKLEPGDEPALTQLPAQHTGGDARRSESARRRPGTPSGFYQVQQPVSAGTAAAGEKSQDLSIALNDYLLDRFTLTEADALYESTRVSLRRRADDRAVDVFEMYWADLSRLGTGGLRALSSLYQLFFHLSTLAADVVDQVSLSTGGGVAWRILQSLHAWSAWLMKAPAAIVQLSMLLLVVFGVTAFVPPEQQGQLLAALFAVGGIALAALAALAWLRGTALLGRWAKLLLLLTGAVASLAAAVVVLQDEGWIARIYFGASALAIALLGAYLIERYACVTRGVRVLGHLLVAATVISLCVEARGLLPQVTTQREWMLTAALHVGEWLLATVLLVWAVFVFVQITALLLGLWLGHAGDDPVKASLHTSRLTLVVSTALFALLSLVLWSVVGYVAGLALNDLYYEPVVFGSGYRSAAIFLEDRVQSLGGFFTPLVLAFMLLAAAGLLVLAPSLLEELSPSKNVDAGGVRRGAAVWSERLGNWLGGGMRRLGKTFTGLVPLGAIAGGALYLAFIFQQFAFSAGVAGSLVQWLAGALEHFQGETLVAAGKWLAGGALTVAALGSRFTQTLGRLRVAIDAVLDIDNYFGDPPNRQPPRARIYSRFASLLSYLRDGGYAHIVIVSHSQGTVISADLLRYLHVRRRLHDVVGAIPVALVTVGSPLRDLYAERFPLLYEWMGSSEAGFTSSAPSASDIGAIEWVNACRSGDYVGRFIWTPPSDTARFRIAVVDSDGKVEAQRAGDRTEFCLGAGGHTHYFSNDAVALAVEIDRLIAG